MFRKLTTYENTWIIFHEKFRKRKGGGGLRNDDWREDTRGWNSRSYIFVGKRYAPVTGVVRAPYVCSGVRDRARENAQHFFSLFVYIGER